MPQARAVFASLMAFCLSVPLVSAQAPTAAGKSPVIVRSVHFDPVKIGGQKNDWIRMQVELQANFNPETKVPADEQASKRAANKMWVDKV
jgi:hypothetical protein